MRFASLAILFAAAWLLLAGLGERELYSSHEARAAMNAVSLLEGEPLPRLFDGTRDLQKPALYYVLVALAGWVCGGVDGWAVRLPSALSAFGIVGLLLAFGWRMKRPLIGLFAAVVLIATVHFPWLARIGRIDMPLAFCVSAAGISFLLALRGERSWLWLAYPACAAGVLLKGPIGLVLPVTIVAALLLAEGRWPAIWESRPWVSLLSELSVIPGLTFVIGVTLPLFVWMQYASDGQFFHEFFWLHNVQRGLGGSRLRSHPWWLYGPYLLLYLMPATPLIFWGLFSPARRDSLARAGLAWLVGVVIVLSAAKFKRADYLLPAYPGAALFLGCIMEHWSRGRPRLVIGGAVLATLGSMLGWGVYLYVHLPMDAAYRDYRPIAALIRQQDKEEILFFRAEAHALLYRIGRPARVLIDWDELKNTVQKTRLVVVPTKLLDEIHRNWSEVTIETVSSTEHLAGGSHERPLVVLRVSPKPR